MGMFDQIVRGISRRGTGAAPTGRTRGLGAGRAGGMGGLGGRSTRAGTTAGTTGGGLAGLAGRLLSRRR